jgi:hypothetical protein
MKYRTITTADGYTFYRVMQGDQWVWVDNVCPSKVDMTYEDRDGVIVFDPEYQCEWDVIPMEWRDSNEGPFDNRTDAEDYVRAEFHAPTRILETPDGWVIKFLNH